MRAWPARSLPEGAFRRSELGGIASSRRSPYLLQTASSSLISKQGIRAPAQQVTQSILMVRWLPSIL
jgi:hypothetical protein